jgi:hypothetical protein
MGNKASRALDAILSFKEAPGAHTLDRRMLDAWTHLDLTTFSALSFLLLSW